MDQDRQNQGEDLTAQELLALMQGEGAPPEGEDDKQQAQTQDFVPKDRFDEVMARMRRAEEQNDRLIRQGLAPREPQQEYQKPQDWDEEVAQQVLPILKHEFGQYQAQLLQQLEPLIQHATRQMGLERLKDTIPDFGDVEEQVRREFDALPDDQKSQYDNPVGAEALYGRVVARMRSSQQQAPRRTASTARAHSVTGTSGSAPDRLDPYNISPEAFERLLDKIREET